MKFVATRPHGRQMRLQPRAANLGLDGEVLLLRAPGVRRRLDGEDVAMAAVVGVRQGGNEDRLEEIRVLFFLVGRDQPYMVPAHGMVAERWPGLEDLGPHARLCDRVEQWLEELDRRRIVGDLLVPENTREYFEGHLPQSFPEAELYRPASEYAGCLASVSPVPVREQATVIPSTEHAAEPNLEFSPQEVPQEVPQEELLRGGPRKSILPLLVSIPLVVLSYRLLNGTAEGLLGRWGDGSFLLGFQQGLLAGMNLILLSYWCVGIGASCLGVHPVYRLDLHFRLLLRGVRDLFLW